MRSFIYLDQYKLYSFSSQLFSGLVDHVVSVSERTRSHDQKTPSTDTARIVAEIASESATLAEKKFLHDHAYDLFESELQKANALLDVASTSVLGDFHDAKFIRVSGPGIFQDSQRTCDVIENFNLLLEASTYVSSIGKKEAMIKTANETEDRKAKERVRAAIAAMTPKAMASASGARQDEAFVKQLAYLLKYGFRDQFLLQIPIQTEEDGLLFSAVLDRTSLRERESILLQKYSRVTDRSLVVVGIPTQAGGGGPPELEAQPGLRTAAAFLDLTISEMLGQFTGRFPSEVVVDPVAIYVEWSVGNK